jgi:hypothetical protein
MSWASLAMLTPLSWSVANVGVPMRALDPLRSYGERNIQLYFSRSRIPQKILVVIEGTRHRPLLVLIQ